MGGMAPRGRLFRTVRFTISDAKIVESTWSPTPRASAKIAFIGIVSATSLNRELRNDCFSRCGPQGQVREFPT
jgi:hypothetical protein